MEVEARNKGTVSVMQVLSMARSGVGLHEVSVVRS